MYLADYFIKEIKKYHRAFMQKKVLRTMEEVEANTDEENIPSATALAELSNDLPNLLMVGAVSVLIPALSANGRAEKVVSCARDGYKPLAVAGIGGTPFGATPTVHYINGDNLHCSYVNYTSAVSKEYTAAVYILYFKIN